MIEELLPSMAAVSATARDLPYADLCPEELASARRMVPERRQEFATGRHCARQALVRLGIPPGPILSSPSASTPNRMRRLPVGYVRTSPWVANGPR